MSFRVLIRGSKVRQCSAAPITSGSQADRIGCVNIRWASNGFRKVLVGATSISEILTKTRKKCLASQELYDFTITYNETSGAAGDIEKKCRLQLVVWHSRATQSNSAFFDFVTASLIFKTAKALTTWEFTAIHDTYLPWIYLLFWPLKIWTGQPMNCIHSPKSVYDRHLQQAFWLEKRFIYALYNYHLVWPWTKVRVVLTFLHICWRSNCIFLLGSFDLVSKKTRWRRTLT